MYTITHKLGGNGGSIQADNQLTNKLIQMQQRQPNALSAALAPLWQSVTSASAGKVCDPYILDLGMGRDTLSYYHILIAKGEFF